MGGKKRILIGLIGLFLLLAWSGIASAIEYGNFAISGWVRNQIAYNVGHANPNNAFFGDDERVNLKMFNTAVQLKPQYKFTDNVSVFARLLGATMGGVDTNYPEDVDHFPKSYDGDLLLTGDDWEIGAKEVYLDLDSQYAWLRLGKQQVSWGQSDGLRLLDIINPLDKTWHGISLNEPYLDAFDNLRESLWMARLTLKSPWETDNLNDVQLELIWMPGEDIGAEWVGHINPVHGSPYNFEPDVFSTTDIKPNGEEFGVRLMGKYRGLEWSLNYFRHYEDDGLYEVVGGWGPDFNSDGFGDLPVAETVHPRMDSYGFSMTYDDALNTKCVYRLEFLFQDRPYEHLATADIERRRTIKTLLGIDRPTFVPFLNPNRTISFGFQAFVTQVVEGGDMKDAGLTLNGSHPNENTTMFSLGANTGYMQDRINPSILWIYDPGRQGNYLQVGTEFRFTDNILWYVGATLYDGKSDTNAANDNIGYFAWSDEIQSRITLQF